MGVESNPGPSNEDVEYTLEWLKSLSGEQFGGSQDNFLVLLVTERCLHRGGKSFSTNTKVYDKNLTED